MAAVRDNKALGRFELDVEGAMAFANYRVTPQAVIITHTETPRALRGRGLAHHLLVQPDVHAGGIIGVAGVAELLGELLAGRKAGIDVERLHQVDDGVFPIELLPFGSNRLVEDGSDVDGLRRCRTGRCGRAAGLRAACGCGASLAAEDRAHDASQNTIRSLPTNWKMPWSYVAHSFPAGPLPEAA